MRIPADYIQKCVGKLHSDICSKEDELDELYDKIHEGKKDLASVRYIRPLMKIYLKKVKEMDENITLVDHLHVICTDIMNDTYKQYFNVINYTTVDNISVLKKELLNTSYVTYNKCIVTA